MSVGNTHKTKQLFNCKNLQRKFKDNDDFEFKFDLEDILTLLILYSKSQLLELLTNLYTFIFKLNFVIFYSNFIGNVKYRYG